MTTKALACHVATNKENLGYAAVVDARNSVERINPDGSNVLRWTVRIAADYGTVTLSMNATEYSAMLTELLGALTIGQCEDPDLSRMAKRAAACA